MGKILEAKHIQVTNGRAHSHVKNNVDTFSFFLFCTIKKKKVHRYSCVKACKVSPYCGGLWGSQMIAERPRTQLCAPRAARSAAPHWRVWEIPSVSCWGPHCSSAPQRAAPDWPCTQPDPTTVPPQSNAPSDLPGGKKKYKAFFFYTFSSNPEKSVHYIWFY